MTFKKIVLSNEFSQFALDFPVYGELQGLHPSIGFFCRRIAHKGDERPMEISVP